MDYCTCCEAEVDRLKVSVRCSLCQSLYKPECVDLSYSEAYKVNRNVGLSWTCKNCLQISNDTNLLKRENALLHAKLQAALGRFGKKQHNDGVREVPRFGCGYPLRNVQLGSLSHQRHQDGRMATGRRCRRFEEKEKGSHTRYPSMFTRLLNRPLGIATNETTSAPKTTGSQIKPLHFNLLHLDDEDLVSNTEIFECAICLTEVELGQGAILKHCLHQFCKQCLAQAVEHSNDAEIKCPYRDDHYSCDSLLQDREIKALVKPEVYEQYLARSIAEAENKIQNSFHCRTPNCIGWCIYEDDVNTFRCPTCTKENCLTCRAIHAGMNCKQYQEKVRMDVEKNQNARNTEVAITKMIEKGEAMNCPGCKAVITREDGCDWILCTACKMEICWVTKGPRWGSGGRGDTSGGCKCGVYGRKCHPRCKNCH